MYPQLETYLAELRATLAALPQKQREEEIAEARQHLEALIAKRIENGDSAEAAIAAALQQFGGAYENGKALYQTWKRGREKRRPQLRIVRQFLWAMCLVLVFLFGVGTFSLRTTINHSQLSDGRGVLLQSINQTHEDEQKAIQARWNADNLAIQKMNKRNAAAISRAQGTAMQHFAVAMNDSNTRWQDKITTLNRTSFILQVATLMACSLLLLLAGTLVMHYVSANVRILEDVIEKEGELKPH